MKKITKKMFQIWILKSLTYMLCGMLFFSSIIAFRDYINALDTVTISIVIALFTNDIIQYELLDRQGYGFKDVETNL